MSLVSRNRCLVLCGLIILMLTACQAYQLKGTQYPDLQPAPDFELSATDGQRYRLSDHQGNIVLIFFGYTSCPDICPTTLADARQIINGLENEADRLTFLFVTVDPERDTTEVLATYVTAFHPAILGLTGTSNELEAVRHDYGVFIEKETSHEANASHLVNHTARVYLVDAEGRLKLSYAFSTPPDDILQDIRHLLG